MHSHSEHVSDPIHHFKRTADERSVGLNGDVFPLTCIEPEGTHAVTIKPTASAGTGMALRSAARDVSRNGGTIQQ
jgi:hypothetical protein